MQRKGLLKFSDQKRKSASESDREGARNRPQLVQPLHSHNHIDIFTTRDDDDWSLVSSDSTFGLDKFEGRIARSKKQTTDEEGLLHHEHEHGHNIFRSQTFQQICSQLFSICQGYLRHVRGRINASSALIVLSVTVMLCFIFFLPTTHDQQIETNNSIKHNTRWDPATKHIPTYMNGDLSISIPIDLPDKLLEKKNELVSPPTISHEENPEVIDNIERNENFILPASKENLNAVEDKLVMHDTEVRTALSDPSLHVEDSVYHNENVNLEDSTSSILKVAYILPVFECPRYKAKDYTATENEEIHEKIEDTAFLDAAAVLKYSIHRNSIHNPQGQGRYSYQMIALVHSAVKDCYDPDGYGRTEALRLLGYETRIVDDPVKIEDIEGQYLREALGGSSSNINALFGNAGRARELIQMHAFNLVDYEIAVLVDLRTLVVRPLDHLFDLLLVEESSTSKYVPDIQTSYNEALSKIELAKNAGVPSLESLRSLSIIFTRDFSSVTPRKHQVGIHTGLLVLKPSLDTYKDLLSILRAGDYNIEGGWGGSGIGNFWGAMTTRGLLSFYYDKLHPERSLEIHRCKYNNMGSSPFIRVDGQTICRNTQESPPACDDCRERSIEENVVVANTSACRDPWSCYRHRLGGEPLKLCREMHRFWFLTRRELEAAWAEWGGGGEFGYTPVSTFLDKDHPHQFLGYCSGYGKEHYIRMAPPGKEAEHKKPALDANEVLYQFDTGMDGKSKINNIQKPKKHFDPQKIMFQFYGGHAR